MATPAIQVRGLAATRHELFGAVFVLAQLLARRADADLAALGLTTKQWLLLAVLTRRFPGGRPSLGEAAQAYGSSRQNVKQIAGQLQTRGYLRILADPDDRRVLRLQPTPKLAAFDTPAQMARQEALMGEVFAGLSPADLQQMLRLLRRWLGAVAK
jgi:DNA-binding MarR family transcriptional regulator